MVLRRIELHGHVFFVFQIAYTVDETTRFFGMQQFIGMPAGFHENPDTPVAPNDSYISNIHALPLHRWKGSDMVELALGIARALGVKRASLTDATFRACNTESPQNASSDGSVESEEAVGYDLSMIMLLSRHISFYGRFGFRPVVDSVWDHGLLTSGDPIIDMCSALRSLARVRVSSFVKYLRSMINYLDPHVGKLTRGYRLVDHLSFFGVVQITSLTASALREDVATRLPLMRRLLVAFSKHPGITVFLSLFDGSSLSCSIKSDFLNLLRRGHHTLRHSAKGTKGKRIQPADIGWPAWVLLMKVARIRSMRLETIVQSDPDRQRIATVCPTRK